MSNLAARRWNGAVKRLRNLENERNNLLLEIEELRKMLESKEKALQSEVNMLREEVKSLRVLLGADEPATHEEQQRARSSYPKQ
jgi:uncharacterized protein YlxW (UPF0749 family)